MLPVVGAVGSMTMMLVLRGNPLFVLVGVMVLVVALVGGVGMALSHRGTAARGRRLQRERYLDYLEGLRSDLRDAENDARDVARDGAPRPGRPGRRGPRPGAPRGSAAGRDPDFLGPRVGAGDRPWFDLRVPEDPNPTQPFDPAMAAEAEAVRVRHGARPADADHRAAGPRRRGGRHRHPRDAASRRPRADASRPPPLHAPDDLPGRGHVLGGPGRRLGVARRCPAPGRRRALRRSRPRPPGGPGPARPGPRRRPQPGGPRAGRRAGCAAAARVSPRAPPTSRGCSWSPTGTGRRGRPAPGPTPPSGCADLGVTVVHLLADRLHEPVGHRRAHHGRRGRHRHHRGPARRAPGRRSSRRRGRRRRSPWPPACSARSRRCACTLDSRRRRRSGGRGRHRRAARRRRTSTAIDVGRTVGRPVARATSCACPSGSTTPARRCCSTSRSPRSSAWARTACASAPPAPASRRCCAPSSRRWRSRTRPRTWR